jgi:Mitochondrial carrier protein
MSAVSTHDAYFIGLAQGLGAIISIFITYPLQNLVTRFQIHSLLENNANPMPEPSPALPTKPPSSPPPPNSSVQNPQNHSIATKASDWDIFVKIIREEGILKLYTGVTLAMAGTAMQQGIFSYTYETLKQNYKFYNEKDAKTFVNFILGLLSGSLAFRYFD